MDFPPYREHGIKAALPQRYSEQNRDTQRIVAYVIHLPQCIMLQVLYLATAEYLPDNCGNAM
jgi:hypothetical protein